MKICIPIEFKPEGGGQYFLEQFRAFLVANGHTATLRVADRYDVLFTNHWLVPLSGILEAIRHNPDVRIVQRIDGSATDYGRGGDADQRQHEVNRLADLTVFQSEYCRWSTRMKFPVILQDGPVIHNPVDLQRFTPDGPRIDWQETTRLAVVSWSMNPRKGAASVFAVARENPDVHFFLCGRFANVPDLPNLRRLGVVGREHLPNVLRSCDAMLTFSENEACPNHVIEALASGLPVLYLDSGAMREVIGECGLPVTVETFREQLGRMGADWGQWRRSSRLRAVRHFNPEQIFGRYISVINEARKAAWRMPPRTRQWLARGGRAAAWWLGRSRWDRASSSASR